MQQNVFIEGMQGAGKSTLLTRLAERFPECQVYREGSISPADLAWCSYMPERKFEETLELFSGIREQIIANTKKEGDYYITAYTLVLAEIREFYQHMEQYEIYNGRVEFDEFRRIILGRYAVLPPGPNLFECSFFQNSIESMMLFYQLPEREIVKFYREAFDVLKEKDFRLLYLDSDKIRENVLRIKKERSDSEGNEMWYPLMLNYLVGSPCGKAHGYTGLEDMITHFEKRRALELGIIQEVLKDSAVIIPAKEYDLDWVARVL